MTTRAARIAASATSQSAAEAWCRRIKTTSATNPLAALDMNSGRTFSSSAESNDERMDAESCLFPGAGVTRIASRMEVLPDMVRTISAAFMDALGWALTPFYGGTIVLSIGVYARFAYRHCATRPSRVGAFTSPIVFSPPRKARSTGMPRRLTLSASRALVRQPGKSGTLGVATRNLQCATPDCPGLEMAVHLWRPQFPDPEKRCKRRWCVHHYSLCCFIKPGQPEHNFIGPHLP